MFHEDGFQRHWNAYSLITFLKGPSQGNRAAVQHPFHGLSKFSGLRGEFSTHLKIYTYAGAGGLQDRKGDGLQATGNKHRDGAGGGRNECFYIGGIFTQMPPDVRKSLTR